jgi:hypothetical protein
MEPIVVGYLCIGVFIVGFSLTANWDKFLKDVVKNGVLSMLLSIAFMGVLVSVLWLPGALILAFREYAKRKVNENESP